MDYQNIVYNKQAGIARITLNKPEKMNALSMPLLDELDSALLEADQDNDVRVIIIKGAGRAFSAGYDMQPGMPRGYASYSAVDYVARTRELDKKVTAIWNVRKPVIAQVHGYCAAGANEIAGQCDIIIAAENAQFLHPQSRFGVAYAMNMVVYNAGPQWAKMMLFTGDSISGKKAEQIGLIAKAVPENELEARVNELAERIVLMPPDVVYLNKLNVNKVIEEMGLRNALSSSEDLVVISHFTETAQNFTNALKEKGTKAAVSERDAAFRTSPKPKVFED